MKCQYSVPLSTGPFQALLTVIKHETWLVRCIDSKTSVKMLSTFSNWKKYIDKKKQKLFYDQQLPPPKIFKALVHTGNLGNSSGSGTALEIITISVYYEELIFNNQNFSSQLWSVISMFRVNNDLWQKNTVSYHNWDVLFHCKPYFKLGNELQGQLTDNITQITDWNTTRNLQTMERRHLRKAPSFRILSKEINQNSDLALANLTVFSCWRWWNYLST